MTRYLDFPDLVRINERMVEKWGGSAGVGDSDLLEIGKTVSGGRSLTRSRF